MTASVLMIDRYVHFWCKDLTKNVRQMFLTLSIVIYAQGINVCRPASMKKNCGRVLIAKKIGQAKVASPSVSDLP